MSSFVNQKTVFWQFNKLAGKFEIEKETKIIYKLFFKYNYIKFYLNKKIKIDNTKSLTKRQFFKLFFDNICFDCCKMSIIPHGGFAVHKVRERQLLHLKMQQKNNNSSSGYKKNLTDEARELTPLKYNSKLMNSIWGLYNRYSPHNFKKNTDANETVEGVFSAAWGKFLHDNTSPAQTSSARNIAAVKH